METTMTEQVEAIWGRKSPRMIMKEARRIYRQSDKRAGAHVQLASAHYSLVKSYLESWWQKPLAAWHMWMAVSHAKATYRLRLENADQADVVSRIILKTPSWLGGNPELAEKIAKAVVDVSNFLDESPHTLALLRVTLSECQMAKGNYAMAHVYMDKALQLESDIMAEPDKSMAERQLCRILTSAGVLFCEHGHPLNWGEGKRLLDRAYAIATRVSYDQALKINAEINRLDRLRFVWVSTNH